MAFSLGKLGLTGVKIKCVEDTVEKQADLESCLGFWQPLLIVLTIPFCRSEVIASDEIAIVHVHNRTVRRCFLLGNDSISDKNFDHRKQ